MLLGGPLAITTIGVPRAAILIARCLQIIPLLERFPVTCMIKFVPINLKKVEALMLLWSDHLMVWLGS